MRILDFMGEMDVHGPLRTNQSRTLNQLVEGSSPSRLTGHTKGTKRQSRANWRGSSFLVGGFPTLSVHTNVEC